jgi:hypothetical protein
MTRLRLASRCGNPEGGAECQSHLSGIQIVDDEFPLRIAVDRAQTVTHDDIETADAAVHLVTIATA